MATRLLTWFDQHGRHDLPWQHPRTPYRVWVAEIMLQQTQVSAVIPYFERFLARFPDVRSLAAAEPDEVMQCWAGLGYYARARNLHRAARVIHQQHGDAFPREFEQLHALPGIGRSTAAAILAQAFDQRHPILDGNVKRVLARYHAVAGWPGEKAVEARLWRYAEQHTPLTRLADYTQAVMDLGATLCTRSQPACPRCPLRMDCVAYRRRAVANFPAPRPKRHRPRRHTRMLVIARRDGAVLLVRRPHHGIWGGLWSLPEITARESPAIFCRREYGLMAGATKKLPLIEHGFTHFDLSIQPLRARVHGQSTASVETAGRLWYKPGEILPGVPAPVRKLLEQVTA